VFKYGYSRRWKMKKMFLVLALLAVVSCAHSRPPIDPAADPSPMAKLQCPGGKVSVGDCQRSVIERCGLPLWWRSGPWGFTSSRPVREGWVYRHAEKYYHVAFENGAIFWINETGEPKAEGR
jgi:hypothetical protein